jgi:hypothetical protein
MPAADFHAASFSRRFRRFLSPSPVIFIYSSSPATLALFFSQMIAAAAID